MLDQASSQKLTAVDDVATSVVRRAEVQPIFFHVQRVSSS